MQWSWDSQYWRMTGKKAFADQQRAQENPQYYPTAFD